MKNYYRIYGDPVPYLAPKTVTRIGRGGKRYIAHISPPKYVAWKKFVEQVVKSAFDYDGPIIGPVALTLEFYFKRARTSKREYPDIKPDLSNFVKGIEDAVKNGILMKDDCQVIECLSGKYFATKEHPPGVIIKIAEWKGEKANGMDI